eukprot:g17957.t1
MYGMPTRVMRTAVLLCTLQTSVVLGFAFTPGVYRSYSSRQGVGSLRAGLLDDIGKMASQLGARGSGGPIGPALFSDSSDPSWSSLRTEAVATPTGVRIEENKRLWNEGAGPPHTDAKLRLFGSTGEPRVVFYRDTAAWCPYCQKVWMMLEEKRIPYRVEKINMRSYGEKPAWYLAKVPSASEEEKSPDEGFSLVDLTYVPHLERMAASTAYWKGLQLRGNPRWPAINRWFEALEVRPTYMATKSDFYTHVQDIPPQYGNGQGVQRASKMKSTIDGTDGSWCLPLPPLDPYEGLEPVSENNNPGEEGARHEAAYKLTGNAEAVAKFACRGSGRGSGWNLLPGRAPLSDPNATPNLDILPDVDFCLRRVVSALLKGSLEDDTQALKSGAASNGGHPGTAAAVEASLVYLRDRVGVPRDMSYPAARQLRAHLNWAINTLK